MSTTFFPITAFEHIEIFISNMLEKKKLKIIIHTAIFIAI